MKLDRYLLWALLLLLSFHFLTTMLTAPEFHVLTDQKLQELTGQLTPDTKEPLLHELMLAQWSVKNARGLAGRTGILDVIMITILAIVMVKSSGQFGDSAKHESE